MLPAQIICGVAFNGMRLTIPDEVLSLSLSFSLSLPPSLPPSLRLSISESLCVSDCVQVDDRLASLMQCCWLEEPADRPSFDEIKERLRPLLQQAELAEREGRHGPTAQRSGVSDAST